MAKIKVPIQLKKSVAKVLKTWIYVDVDDDFYKLSNSESFDDLGLDLQDVNTIKTSNELQNFRITINTVIDKFIEYADDDLNNVYHDDTPSNSDKVKIERYVIKLKQNKVVINKSIDNLLK